MLGKAATRFATTLAAALFFVTVAVTSGQAQGTTGKIQGRVVSTAGQPIASAQVTVDGTNLGNITNDEGFYFINQVPAGLHTIRAQSIGYRTVLTSDERVLAGQTTTLNFQLEQTAVALDALVVTGERNPLVPRDQVSSKAIVTGETIDQMPLDNSSSIILLQPGVIETNSGFSIRGSREGEEGVYLDGVPIRSLRSGTQTSIELGTNALAQVDVTTGGIGARYGNAQSGVINYVTRSGGSDFGGTFSFYSDRLAPEKIKGGFSRAELSVGGPVTFIKNLNFFAAATLEGNKYGGTNQDNPYNYFVPVGVDTTIRIGRTGQVAGATDSVDVVIPEFAEWSNGPTVPTGVSDEVNLTSKLTYGIGRGSKLDLTYYFNRDQSIGRGTGDFLNPDAWRGSYATRNMVTLGGYFLIAQSSERQIALDLKASYQKEWGQSGMLDRSWQEDHLFPAFGFNVPNLKFIFDPDDHPVTDEFLLAARSGVLPPRILAIQPGVEVPLRQGFSGVNQNLRLNPYAMRSDFPISGTGNTSQAYSQESRWYLNGQIDWQMNRFNRLFIGGEMTTADARSLSVPLYDGTPGGAHYEPRTAGLFLQDRLDIGDVVLEGGVRMDYYRPDGLLPRLPGYRSTLPDSLTLDAWQLRPGDEPYSERLEQVVDCGGPATAADRTRADGTVVCKNNFIETKTRTVFSPKLAVSFPVTATSTFRLSYNQNVQPVALNTMLRNALNDLAADNLNNNSTFGRDVELPKTVLFEAGYRQVFTGNTVADVAVYSKTTRNALTYRKIRYTDPNTGGELYLNSLTNADYSLARGLDVRVDRRISEIADLSLNYSFVDARGTGSDPFTYTGLILRSNTNLSIITGTPIEPPEILQTLDQSRAHNLSGTLSLQFGNDFLEDNRIANAVLSDLGLYVTMQIASGLPYTRLLNNGNGQTGPPTFAGLSGVPDESLNASRSPGTKRFDLRLTKGFQVLGKSARLFADARNPLHLANTGSVFLETGTIVNQLWYDQELGALLIDQAGYTGSTGGKLADQVIATWPAENAVNKYMLARAEERFGDGDGIFTAAEQRKAWETYFRLVSGGMPWRLRTAPRSLRLGFEVTF